MASGGLPTSVTMTNTAAADCRAGVGISHESENARRPYTIQVNANYTNPQFQPAVAMDPYGNFVIVWANQGPDESYFNDIRDAVLHVRRHRQSRWVTRWWSIRTRLLAL